MFTSSKVKRARAAAPLSSGSSRSGASHSWIVNHTWSWNSSKSNLRDKVRSNENSAYALTFLAAPCWRLPLVDRESYLVLKLFKVQLAQLSDR